MKLGNVVYGKIENDEYCIEIGNTGSECRVYRNGKQVFNIRKAIIIMEANEVTKLELEELLL